MAAVMDLDLNCSPPSPEPAAQDDLRRSVLRQQLTFRGQVKDLHNLYWTRNDLTDVPPFWNHSSDAHHPSHMVDFGATKNTGVFRHCRDLGKQAARCHNEVKWDNFDGKGSILRKSNSSSVPGRSDHRCLIDLEKPATLDDDVEIVSSAAFTNYANHNVGLSDNSQILQLETSTLMSSQLCSAPYLTSGSTGSSGTPDSASPVRAKNAVYGRMCIDLNVAQEDDSNICPEPSSIVLCSLMSSSATRRSGDFSNNSSKTFLKGSESSIVSSKGSSITVVTAISPPYSSREAMAAGVFRDTTQGHKPLCVEASRYNQLPIRSIHHQHARHTISGLDSQGYIEIPRKVLSVCSNGENSSLGLPKLGGSQAINLMGQPAIAVHRERPEETITVLSDDEVAGFDLNVSVESIDFPQRVTTTCDGSKPVNNDRSEEDSPDQCVTHNEVRQTVSSAECATIISRDQHMAESSEDVQSPGCGIATDRRVFIPETPQGRDYASPRLRSSSNGVSISPEAVSIHEAGDEEDAAMAAETLVSIFSANYAWMADSQTDGEDGRHEAAAPSLNSFEESILKLEETRDDGASMRARAPPDKDDGACCGIKLKRGRGLRDFQREILPGIVSLARHEICDDLHAIGHEMRKTRSSRIPTRTRLSRRCSTAWN